MFRLILIAVFFSSAVCASEAELRLTTTDGPVIVQGDDVFLLPNTVTRYEPVEFGAEA